MEKIQLFLRRANDCMKAVQKMSSRKLNNDQCGYLAEKLKVVVEHATLFLELLRAKGYGPCSSVVIAMQVELFKLLAALAKQTENFIEACCKDAWIQTAMTLSTVSNYVSFLGFNLELCRIAFDKDSTTIGSLNLDDVQDIYKAEVKIVERKATADGETLFDKLITEMPSLSSEKRDLTKYLIQVLQRIKPTPTSLLLSSIENGKGEEGPFGKLFTWVKIAVKPTPTSLLSKSSIESDNDEEGSSGKLFKSVKTAESLGRGASGAVHKAIWFGIPVAKKTFHGQDNLDFLKEVQILSRLHHPNIMPMFCWAKNKRSCSFIMELMDEDLRNVIETRLEADGDSPPFPIFEAVDIILQIGEGVNYLHNNGIVHRDLKSMNILVKHVKASEPEIGYLHVKVADFGLSKTKERSTTYSNQTYNTGTNRWMPPEVIKLTGSGKSILEKEDTPKYPFKCDIYSFAMVCYEILTGNVPFASVQNLNMVKHLVIEGQRPNLPDDCPSKLKALIEKCWSQDPKERPAFGVICMELRHAKYLLMRALDSQSKGLCLKEFPEVNSFKEVEEKNPTSDAQVRSGCSGSSFWKNLEKDERIYQHLFRELKHEPIDKTCILEAISASSTDYSSQSILQTLNLSNSSFWSSTGRGDVNCPETLTYNLISNLCVVHEVHIQPFQATGFGIFSSKFVRIRLGHWNLGYVWSYESPIFIMEQVSSLQVFKLPRPVLCIGGVLQVELLGPVQTDRRNRLYYICIQHVSVVGCPLSGFRGRLSGDQNKFILECTRQLKVNGAGGDGSNQLLVPKEKSTGTRKSLGALFRQSKLLLPNWFMSVPREVKAGDSSSEDSD